MIITNQCCPKEVVQKVICRTIGKKMDRLNKDIVDIISRFIHNDSYKVVRDEFTTIYVPMWQDSCSYYKNTGRTGHNIVIAMWRSPMNTNVNIPYFSPIFNMLDRDTQRCFFQMASTRGGIKGYLPKNY